MAPSMFVADGTARVADRRRVRRRTLRSVLTPLLLSVLMIPGVLTVAACGGNDKKTDAKSTGTTAGDIAECAASATDVVVLSRLDGAKIDGLILGKDGPAVVLANQITDDLCQWLPFAYDYVKQGYRAVVFNYSSVAPPDEDVLAAVDAVRSHGAAQVFLIGASKGGTSVLVAATKANPPVNGVVDLSGPEAISGVSASTAVKTLKTPVLFMAGEYDEPYASDTKSMYKACGSTDKKLMMLPSGSHGEALLDAAVRADIAKFLTAHK